MRITVRNDFHNSESIIQVPRIPYTLSTSQTAKLKRELCGNKDCICGGPRGPQEHNGRALVIGWDLETVPATPAMRVEYKYHEEANQ